MIYSARGKDFTMENYSEELVKKHIGELLEVDKVIANYPKSKSEREDREEKWNLDNFIYHLPNKEKLSRLVFHEEKCVGYMIASSYEEKSHLSRIAILDEFHGYGLGKELMRILETESKNLGLKKVTLSTLYKGSEDKVVIFYKKLGYSILETEEEIREFLKDKNKESDLELFWPWNKPGNLLVMSKAISV